MFGLFCEESFTCLKLDLLDAVEMEELREKASIVAQGKYVKEDAR